MAAPASAPFRLGTKQVFLSKHIVTLLRPKRDLPPNFATFKVPLHFNKLDFRDYLLNLYNVPTTKVRSHIIRSALWEDEVTKRVRRPRPTKYMTVEMMQPFVWPAEPDEKEKEKWHDEMTRARIKDEEKRELAGRNQVLRGELALKNQHAPTYDRLMLREQAEDLVSGKVKWKPQRPLDPKWDDETQHRSS